MPPPPSLSTPLLPWSPHNHPAEKHAQQTTPHKKREFNRWASVGLDPFPVFCCCAVPPRTSHLTHYPFSEVVQSPPYPLTPSPFIPRTQTRSINCKWNSNQELGLPQDLKPFEECSTSRANLRENHRSTPCFRVHSTNRHTPTSCNPPAVGRFEKQLLQHSLQSPTGKTEIQRKCNNSQLDPQTELGYWVLAGRFSELALQKRVSWRALSRAVNLTINLFFSLSLTMFLSIMKHKDKSLGSCL